MTDIEARLREVAAEATKRKRYFHNGHGVQLLQRSCEAALVARVAQRAVELDQPVDRKVRRLLDWIHQTHSEYGYTTVSELDGEVDPVRNRELLASLASRSQWTDRELVEMLGRCYVQLNVLLAQLV